MFCLFLFLSCECEKLDYIRALRNSDIAFEGIVLEISNNIAILKVINPIKQAKDSIYTVYNQNECPFNFIENRIYRVFLKAKDGKYFTNNCMGNSSVEDNDDYRDYSE